MLIIWKKLKETFTVAISQDNPLPSSHQPPQIISEPTIQGVVHTATISVGNVSNVPPGQVETVRLWHEQLVRQGVAVGAHFTGAHVDTAQFNLLNLEAAVSAIGESKTASITADLPSTQSLTPLQTTWCFSGENQLDSLSIHIGTSLRQEDFARLGLPTQTLLVEDKRLKPAAHQQLYEQLRQHLPPVDQNTIGNRVILVGAPGLGKSYCAQHYLYHTASGQHNMVAWLSGSSKESFDRDWSNLASKFRWMDSELSEADDTTAIYTWCEKKLGQWLLIVDDMNTNPYYLEQRLPHYGGHVLLTTRHPHYCFSESSKESTVKRLHFLPLNLHDSRQIVEAYFGRYWSNTGHAAEEQAFEQLCTAMGGNPLALAQAALLICKKGLSFQRFMSQFQNTSTQAYLLQDRVFEELSLEQTVSRCWMEIRQSILITLKVALSDKSDDELENDLTTFILTLLDLSRDAFGNTQAITSSVKQDDLEASGLHTTETLTAYQTYLPAYLPLSFDGSNNTWHLTSLSLALLQILITDEALTVHINPAIAEEKVIRKKLEESKTGSLSAHIPQVTPTRPVEVNFSLAGGAKVGDIYIKAGTENYQQRQKRLEQGWKLPRPNPHFIPRQKLTDELAQKLPAETKEGTTQQVLLTTAVTGMGGVGKTELARHFITQHLQSQTYRYRLWLDASTPSRLYNEFREIAEYLRLIERQPFVSDEEMLVRVKKWLAINKGWLLVLDNADQYNAIKTLIPEVGGCVMVTTRDKRPGTLPQERVVEVSPLAPEEALNWLCKLAHRPEEILGESEKVAAKQLLDKLGYLPLAIAQAAAYLSANPNITIATYLEQFSALLSDKTHARNIAGDQPEETSSRLVVSSTWDLSLQQIKKKVTHPQIIDGLLGLCAYLVAKDIPLCVLEAWLKVVWQGQVRDPNLLNYWLDEYLGQLLRYSLIDRDSQAATLSLHNLIQEVKRSQLTLEGQHAQIGSALQCLIAANPQEDGRPEAEQLWRSFLPHLEAMITHQDQTRRREDGLLAVALGQLANIYLYMLKQPNKGRNVSERALKIQQTNYRRDQDEVEIILGNLNTSNSALDEMCRKQNLRLYNTSIVPNLLNLANAYGDLGDVNQKRDLLERALEIQETHYGKDHYEVAAVLTSLGNAYDILGDFVKQKNSLERALKIGEAHYGSNHYQVAKVLLNLSSAYRAIGDVYQQRDLLERALKIQEAHYGENHCEVAKILEGLGDAYGALGDVRRQQGLLERALKIFETNYGKDHYDVAHTLANLGAVYGALGNVHRERDLYERALKIQETHYGKNHYGVAATLMNLGTAYGSLGDIHHQLNLLKRALKIQEAHYGNDHYMTVSALINLGIAYGAQAEAGRHRDLCERALKIQEAHYGKDHYQVALVLGNLANAYGALGDVHRELALVKRALKIFEKHYGKDHYEVGMALNNLGTVYSKLGNAVKQRAFITACLEDL